MASSIQNQIQAVLKEHLDGVDGPEFNAMIEELAEILSAPVQSKPKSKPKPKATKTKTSSGGKRPATEFAKFLQVASEARKGRPVGQLTVKPAPNFGANADKSLANFHRLKAAGLDFQEQSLGELVTAVFTETKNAVSAASVVWGLMSEGERKAANEFYVAKIKEEEA